jgi:hypothetical protein
MSSPVNGAGLLGLLTAGVTSLFGSVAWFGRRAVKRIDRLERNSVRRSEFEELREAREHADEVRGIAIQRLEDKIDRYHSDLTARIDRLLGRRG